MKVNDLHRWDVTVAEAREIQTQLRERLSFDTSISLKDLKWIAAADISFSRFGKELFAAVVLMSFPDLQLQNVYLQRTGATFPYIPGYLSFREAPAVIEIFKQANTLPDVLLCDGHGIAHPRGFGLAAHLGVYLEIPSVGCAKTVLVGEYEEPEMEKGSVSDLVLKGKTVGQALRTRSGVKPVYVSCGHKLSLKNAVKIVLASSPRYRIPEPLRIAHQKVNEFRREREDR